MAEFPVMPVFTDSLIADTIDLSATQFGAYFLLLMTAWRSKENALPDNDQKLARWARLDPRTWRAQKSDILSRWHLGDDGFWRQGRLDDERKRAVELRSKNADAGRASALKRQGRHSTNVKIKINEQAAPLTSPLEVEEGLSKPSLPPKPNLDPDFIDFWSRWRPFDMDKGSKESAKKSYMKARRDSSHEAIIGGLERYCDYCAARQQRTRHAATWLNQRGWEDEQPTIFPAPGAPANGKSNYGDSLANAARAAQAHLDQQEQIRGDDRREVGA